MNAMKLNLQLFAQTFDPDNVTMYEHKDGTIPEKYNTLILEEIMENSKVMQLAKYEEMDSKEKSLNISQKDQVLTGSVRARRSRHLNRSGCR